MLTFLPPQSLTMEQWQMIEESISRPPVKAERWTPLEAAEALLSGRWLAFSCPGGIVVVEKQARNLLVHALNIRRFGWRLRAFRNAMDRLASSLMCDTVETTCFDERLARAMQRIHAKPVSWQMQWQVEGADKALSKEPTHG